MKPVFNKKILLTTSYKFSNFVKLAQKQHEAFKFLKPKIKLITMSAI